MLVCCRAVLLGAADFGSAKIVENVTNKDDPSVNYAYTPLWVAPEVMTGKYVPAEST